MGKRIIAVVDVLDAAKAGSKTIPALPGECIVTAGAREKAAELGIVIADGCEAPQPTAPAAAAPRPVESETVIREVCTLLKSRMPSGVEPGKLEHLVREVVSARLAGPAAVFPATADPSVSRVEGVCFISGSRLHRQRRRPGSRGRKSPGVRGYPLRGGSQARRRLHGMGEGLLQPDR